MPETTLAPTTGTQDRRKALAAQLLRTNVGHSGRAMIRQVSREAMAYHELEPYPWWHFRDWHTKTKIPLPRCMPFGKSAVLRSARWLFGKPIQINIKGNPTLEKLFRNAWTENRMRARMRAAAVKGGIQGGVVLKFSYDGTADKKKLRFQVLSVVDECSIFYDPHDRECALMFRIQYPFYDAIDRAWKMYREEWTDAEFVVYKAVPVSMRPEVVGGFQTTRMMPMIASGSTWIDPDDYQGWEVEGAIKPNPFGVIPMQAIKNIDPDDLWGMGDLWGLYRVWDRVNLTYHNMDLSNQFDSKPNVIFQDVATPLDVVDNIEPGQAVSIKSDVDEVTGEAIGKPGVTMLESKGSLRPAMMEYAKDLRKQVLMAASNVEVDTAEITNKGAMTEAVLAQLYGPLIELTDEKRENYGENGICQFLEKVAVGLKNLSSAEGVAAIPEVGAVDPENEETYDVQIVWPSYFQLTQDELAAVVARTQEEEVGGYLPHDRAVQRIAKLEGIDDIEVLEKELADEAAQKKQDMLDMIAATPTATDPSAAPGKGGAAGGAGSAGDLAVQNAAKLSQTLKTIGGPDSK